MASSALGTEESQKSDLQLLASRGKTEADVSREVCPQLLLLYQGQVLERYQWRVVKWHVYRLSSACRYHDPEDQH